MSPDHRLTVRAAGQAPTSIAIGDALRVGERRLAVIAGPCSVEGRDMLLATAHARCARPGRSCSAAARSSRAPRRTPSRASAPTALELLAEARAETGLPIVTEVIDTRDVDLVAEYADVLQIGARNMQNFALLAERRARRRAPCCSSAASRRRSRELLLAAEYIMAQGNRNVILCERGIRTFETATRNTLDVSAIPVLKRETHLPVIVDPSHAGGRADLVLPLAARRDRCRRRRPDRRGAPRSRDRALRRRPVAHLRRVRRRSCARSPDRRRGRPTAPRDAARDGAVRMIAAWTPPLRRVTPSAAPRAIGTRPSGPRVAYQGEPGAFGEAAVERHWSGGAIATGTPSFARALELLVARGVDLAVIPVSNSTIGAIPSVRELLDAHADAVHQVDEIVLPVRHALVALPGASLDSVRVIGSHFAALAQCAGFLRARPEVSTREAFDTAGAARRARRARRRGSGGARDAVVRGRARRGPRDAGGDRRRVGRRAPWPNGSRSRRAGSPGQRDALRGGRAAGGRPMVTDGPRLRAVRGATTVAADAPALVDEAVAELLRDLLAINRIGPDDVVSAIFSATPDLRSLPPAAAARALGWTDVPMLCMAEMEVEEPLSRCVRVLLHVSVSDGRALRAVYLRDARVLRPDLVERAS